MSDKIRKAFEAWIASVDKRRDANGWEPLTARDVNMLRNGYMEAALAQQPAQAVPEEGDADNAPWMSADTEPAIAWRDGWDACRAAMLAAAPAAPVALEPVAWACTAYKQGVTEQRSLWHGEQGADVWMAHLVGRGCEVTKTPLYAAPPAAEPPGTVKALREKLETVTELLELRGETGTTYQYLRALLAGGEA